MQVFLQLNSPLGPNLGPNFNLTADVGLVSPSTANAASLLAGIIVNVSSLATSITITSVGQCTNNIVLPITQPTTTTTTSSTTTSTTTLPPCKCFKIQNNSSTVSVSGTYNPCDGLGTFLIAPTQSVYICTRYESSIDFVLGESSASISEIINSNPSYPNCPCSGIIPTTTSTTLPPCSEFCFSITNPDLFLVSSYSFTICYGASFTEFIDPGQTKYVCASTVTPAPGLVVTNIGSCVTCNTSTTTTSTTTMPVYEWQISTLLTTLEEAITIGCDNTNTFYTDVYPTDPAFINTIFYTDSSLTTQAYTPPNDTGWITITNGVDIWLVRLLAGFVFETIYFGECNSSHIVVQLYKDNTEIVGTNPNDIKVKFTVSNNTVLNNLIINGSLITYSSDTCTGIVNSGVGFTYTIPAGSVIGYTAMTGPLVSGVGVESGKITSLTAGATTITSTIQVVTVGGNKYVILSIYNVCYDLPTTIPDVT